MEAKAKLGIEKTEKELEREKMMDEKLSLKYKQEEEEEAFALLKLDILRKRHREWQDRVAKEYVSDEEGDDDQSTEGKSTTKERVDVDLIPSKKMVHDHMKELNDLFAEVESEDEECLMSKIESNELELINKTDFKKFGVTIQKVERSQEIQQQRSGLPIIMQEREVIESVHNCLVTVLCGETGSGKSTQIP